METIELSCNEPVERLKQIAWEAFCELHPVEAYEMDPDKFWAYFHSRVPHMTREQMVELLKECQEP